ncbi:hypothetical protein M378DRAFT_163321 [Amanita muscaria Koide BX008]|uniref:Uncharacterized protein n=1 Tax=Amanita muscaria (strain Koide BX008) TaxID=946122 RepID=A0A0C2WRJ9_AMAMK|nr:hypothetical protein M378DRAFT_163321 [Amanita muscaria Koide BX008]
MKTWHLKTCPTPSHPAAAGFSPCPRSDGLLEGSMWNTGFLTFHSQYLVISPLNGKIWNEYYY